MRLSSPFGLRQFREKGRRFGFLHKILFVSLFTNRSPPNTSPPFPSVVGVSLFFSFGTDLEPMHLPFFVATRLRDPPLSRALSPLPSLLMPSSSDYKVGRAVNNSLCKTSFSSQTPANSCSRTKNATSLALVSPSIFEEVPSSSCLNSFFLENIF